MDAMIKKARKILAKENNVNSEKLEYIGFTDCKAIRGDGAYLFQFLIRDPNHKRFKTTVATRNWLWQREAIMKKLSIYIIFIAVVLGIIAYSIRDMSGSNNPIQNQYNQMEQVIQEASK